MPHKIESYGLGFTAGLAPPLVIAAKVTGDAGDFINSNFYTVTSIVMAFAAAGFGAIWKSAAKFDQEFERGSGRMDIAPGLLAAGFCSALAAGTAVTAITNHSALDYIMPTRPAAVTRTAPQASPIFVFQQD